MFDVAYHQLLTDLTAHIDGLEERIIQKLRFMQDPERISYNLEEAAKLTGIGYDSLYSACKAGRLEHWQEGKGSAIIIKRQTLIDYVSKNPKQISIDYANSNSTTQNNPPSPENDTSDLRSGEGSFRAASKRKRLTGD